MTFVILLLLVPASLALDYLVHASPLWVFAASVLAIVPLAEWIRRATEQLARVAGPAIGGLLNVTFGNVAELVIALFVLRSGHADVVKAQITGSIIGNSLLGLGLAIVVGSWGRERQTFAREKASLLSSLFMLCVIALLVPAMFDYAERGVRNPATVNLDEWLSLVVSVILIAVYVANLFYTLVTRRDVFARETGRAPERAKRGTWPVWKSVMVLLAATAVIAWEAELVSSALDATAHSIGMSTFFLGIIVLAIIGNAAEYISAVYFARRDQMGMVMTITVGSSIQVALVTAPVVVLVSYVMGNPMNLVFGSPLELVAIGAAAFIVNAITRDGETTWIEGVLLLAVYVVLGTTFFLVTP